MFQAKTSTLTARLSAADQPAFNAFLKQYQERYNVVFTSFREFLTHVSNNSALFAAQPSADDVIPVNTLSDQIKTFTEVNKIGDNVSAKEVVNAALTYGVLIPQEIAEAVENYAEREKIDENKTPLDVVLIALTSEPKPVEIEKEVPAKLDENQLLLTFTPVQNKCLRTIHSNRADVLKEQESEPQTIEQTALGLMFNKATLGNWSEVFYTGL